MGQPIVVAIDSSDPAERAVRRAGTAFIDPEITLLHVLDPREYLGTVERGGSDIEAKYEQRQEIAYQLLDQYSDILHDLDQAHDTEIRSGDIAREVVACANELDAEHVVIGSHGRTGIDRLLLGSVAETVVRRSPVPVTVVR